MPAAEEPTGVVELAGHGEEEWVVCTVPLPGGDRVATASGDGKVRVFAVETGALEHELDAHLGTVGRRALSALGGIIVVSGGTGDSNVVTWNSASGGRLDEAAAGSGLFALVALDGERRELMRKNRRAPEHRLKKSPSPTNYFAMATFLRSWKDRQKYTQAKRTPLLTAIGRTYIATIRTPATPVLVAKDVVNTMILTKRRPTMEMQWMTLLYRSTYEAHQQLRDELELLGSTPSDAEPVLFLASVLARVPVPESEPGTLLNLFTLERKPVLKRGSDLQALEDGHIEWTAVNGESGLSGVLPWDNKRAGAARKTFRDYSAMDIDAVNNLAETRPACLLLAAAKDDGRLLRLRGS